MNVCHGPLGLGDRKVGPSLCLHCVLSGMLQYQHLSSPGCRGVLWFLSGMQELGLGCPRQGRKVLELIALGIKRKGYASCQSNCTCLAVKGKQKASSFVRKICNVQVTK